MDVSEPLLILVSCVQNSCLLNDFFSLVHPSQPILKAFYDIMCPCKPITCVHSWKNCWTTHFAVIRRNFVVGAWRCSVCVDCCWKLLITLLVERKSPLWSWGIWKSLVFFPFFRTSPHFFLLFLALTQRRRCFLLLKFKPTSWKCFFLSHILDYSFSNKDSYPLTETDFYKLSFYYQNLL